MQLKVILVFFFNFQIIFAFLKSLNTGKDFVPDIKNFKATLSNFTLDEIGNFDVFKKRFNKSYSSKPEEESAMLKFLTNQADIQQHNLKYSAGLVPFERDVWDHSDMTPEEVNAAMNGFRRPVEARAGKSQGSKAKAPKSLNWVEKGFVTPGKLTSRFDWNITQKPTILVQTQGLCGSCWSFSSTGAIEGQIFKKTGRLLKFSEQNLIDCNRDDDVGNFGCDGGDMATAYKHLVAQKGVALSSKYQYRANDTYKCKYKRSQSGGRILSYEVFESGDEKLLRNILAEHGPLAVAIDASLPTFQSYKSGVYFDPKCTKNIDHAVLLVGYGYDKKTKKDYWLVKNSYGTSWGENGYFRIARNARNHCGIAEYVVVPKC